VGLSVLKLCVSWGLVCAVSYGVAERLWTSNDLTQRVPRKGGEESETNKGVYRGGAEEAEKKARGVLRCAQDDELQREHSQEWLCHARFRERDGYI
jgi:hypothetical protein